MTVLTMQRVQRLLNGHAKSCDWALGTMANAAQKFPDNPCMDYLPTLDEEWPHSREM